MARDDIKRKLIKKDYFRRPYIMNSYRDTMKNRPFAGTDAYRSKPHSEFEKPYRNNTYSQMQGVDPETYRKPYQPFSFDFDNIGVESPKNKCNSNLSIGPFDPKVECGTFQVFQPSGKPPFEFFMIQGPGEMQDNVWVAPDCSYQVQNDITGDLVIVGLIDACSGAPVVTKGNAVYPKHTSEANFRIGGEEAEDECPEEALSVTGEDAPVDNDCYSVSGGTAPYTWSIDVGSIDASGCVTVTGECGTATITVEDSCGNIGTKDVRMPSGTWVIASIEDNGCGCSQYAATCISGVFKYSISHSECVACQSCPEWTSWYCLTATGNCDEGEFNTWKSKVIFTWECV